MDRVYIDAGAEEAPVWVQPGHPAYSLELIHRCARGPLHPGRCPQEHVMLAACLCSIVCPVCGDTQWMCPDAWVLPEPQLQPAACKVLGSVVLAYCTRGAFVEDRNGPSQMLVRQAGRGCVTWASGTRTRTCPTASCTGASSPSPAAPSRALSRTLPSCLLYPWRPNAACSVCPP